MNSMTAGGDIRISDSPVPSLRCPSNQAPGHSMTGGFSLRPSPCCAGGRLRYWGLRGQKDNKVIGNDFGNAPPRRPAISLIRVNT